MEKVDNQLPLLGRDWLYRLRLDWPKMLNRGDVGDPRVHTLHSAIWMNEFPEVTKEGLGLLRGIKAEVELRQERMHDSAEVDQSLSHCEIKLEKPYRSKWKTGNWSLWTRVSGRLQ